MSQLIFAFCMLVGINNVNCYDRPILLTPHNASDKRKWSGFSKCRTEMHIVSVHLDETATKRPYGEACARWSGGPPRAMSYLA
jgi:hypothetical protein